jgi:hypothetical protein
MHSESCLDALNANKAGKAFGQAFPADLVSAGFNF